MSNLFIKSNCTVMSVNEAQIYSGEEMKDWVFKVIGIITVITHNYICKDVTVVI